MELVRGMQIAALETPTEGDPINPLLVLLPPAAHPVTETAANRMLPKQEHIKEGLRHLQASFCLNRAELKEAATKVVAVVVVEVVVLVGE